MDEPTRRYTPQDLAAALTIDAFPRSATYDPDWMLENLMGPNALWLVDAITADTVPDGWRHWLTWQKVAACPGVPLQRRRSRDAPRGCRSQPGLYPAGSTQGLNRRRDGIACALRVPSWLHIR